MKEEPLRGVICKMKVALTDPVSYQLPVGDELCAVDRRVGKPLSLSFTGRIFCISCGRKTSKSFAQGYCFPCFKSLAECDLCIMRPETCHHHLGTCRDEQWAQGHCMQHHYVYIANSSGLKVGITRGNQIPTRWIDQGATQAIAIFRVKNRFHSGLLESTLKKHVSDRTDWRKMLKGGAVPVDMRAESEQIIAVAEIDLAELKNTHADLDWEQLDEPPVSLNYPVYQYPEKVNSLNFAQTASISGTLNGIKGQYLIFDHGVINIRKFSGYEIVVE